MVHLSVGFMHDLDSSREVYVSLNCFNTRHDPSFLLSKEWTCCSTSVFTPESYSVGRQVLERSKVKKRTEREKKERRSEIYVLVQVSAKVSAM